MADDPLTRTPVKVGTGAVSRVDGIRLLTDDDIHVAISCGKKQNPDDKDYCSTAGVAILLAVILIAFITLFVHVAYR